MSCVTRECINKFGQDLGKQIWESINQCFDCMPLAATVDDKVRRRGLNMLINKCFNGMFLLLNIR